MNEPFASWLPRKLSVKTRKSAIYLEMEAGQTFYDSLNLEFMSLFEGR